MRCNLTDTVWQIIDKKILRIKEAELFGFFFTIQILLRKRLFLFFKKHLMV